MSGGGFLSGLIMVCKVVVDIILWPIDQIPFGSIITTPIRWTIAAVGIVAIIAIYIMFLIEFDFISFCCTKTLPPPILQYLLKNVFTAAILSVLMGGQGNQQDKEADFLTTMMFVAVRNPQVAIDHMKRKCNPNEKYSETDIITLKTSISLVQLNANSVSTNRQVFLNGIVGLKCDLADKIRSRINDPNTRAQFNKHMVIYRKMLNNHKTLDINYKRYLQIKPLLENSNILDYV